MPGCMCAHVVRWVGDVNLLFMHKDNSHTCIVAKELRYKLKRISAELLVHFYG